MTRALSIALMTVAVFTGTRGYAADIASLAWTESNLDVLRTFDKAAVEDFVNKMVDDGMHATVGEFAWIDLAGDERYELATRQDLSGRAYFDYLAVYWRSPAGKVTRDWIEGVDLPSLDKIVRDLDGDGKDELIVPSALDRHDPRGYPGYPARVWPKVYRLRNGHYVDASAEYAAFYDNEVLPTLEQAIEQARRDVSGKPGAMSAVWWKSERKASSSGAVGLQLRPLGSGCRRMTPWEAIAGSGTREKGARSPRTPSSA